MDDNSLKTLYILTVCTGNICRSPIAEGILKKLLADSHSIKISSAGTHALDGNPASEFALITAHENGIDISGHCSRPLDKKLIRNSNFILCMEPIQIEWILSLDPSVYEKVYNLAEFSGDENKKKIPDPYGSSLREYRECFKDIALCLNSFVPTIISSA